MLPTDRIIAPGVRPIKSISPVEYAVQRRAGNPARLIDVREPWEFEVARIDGAQLMPLGEIYEWAASLDRGGSYVLMCHHGIRSALACQVLHAFGFDDVTNLEGGIDAWACFVDPTVRRY